MGQAEEYLDRIPMWTRKKNSLEDVRRFLDYLGNPDRDRPAIHLAGTNGKGSVCAFLTSILGEAGSNLAPPLAQDSNRTWGKSLVSRSYSL